MACEICEHCDSPASTDERMIMRDGYSYHKKCHKCYVCSETDLYSAEVFKGVIFCSACAQRIFQGCSTARKTKTMHGGKGRRTRSKSNKRRDKAKTQERRLSNSRDGVIELARLAGSNTTVSDDVKQRTPRKTSKAAMTMEPLYGGINRYAENCYCVQPVVQYHMKKCSTEMGTTTDVTQELLKEVNYADTDHTEKSQTPEASPPPKRRKRKRKESYEPSKNQPICSDLRIAELGMSTEIANMALRKNSEVPVIIKSTSRLKDRTTYSLSVLKQESDVSGDGSDWNETPCSTADDTVATTKIMDRRLGSLMKMPLRFFKTNILTRSSLISILISTENGKNTSLLRRMKRVFYEEVAEHQSRGIKRLYSTINRRKTPYKLGWIDLVANVTRKDGEEKAIIANNSLSISSKPQGCKHVRNSHSYRCMRDQVMKIAGPSPSQLKTTHTQPYNFRSHVADLALRQMQEKL